jgi:transposase-like protein
MQRSKQPLLNWFYGIYLVTTLTPGISAAQLQKQLRIPRYETAFQMLHKIRSAMVAPGREPLHDKVEIDETMIGGIRPGGSRGRSNKQKTLVIGAVEVREGKKGKPVAGRVRLRAISDASRETFETFVQDTVEVGSTVLTDGFASYDNLTLLGYYHEPEVGAPLDLIHREFANLKTWLRGTHHSRVERKHLQAYLNEFCFRHNRRYSPFHAFLRVLQLGIKAPSPTYGELYSTDDYGRGVHPV